VTRTVVVVARDAGAASALVPVLRLLRDDSGFEPVILAWGKARPILEAEGLPVLTFPEVPDAGEVRELFQRVDAAALLTGTSMKTELDSRFWLAADQLGLASVALLDHWTNYAERFSVDAPLDRLPALIAVTDETAAAELVARGCPVDRIRITGNPRFDDLPESITTELREQARQTLGIELDRQVAVFASQPLARHYRDALGYTEVEAVTSFLDGLAEVAPESLGLIKLHPLESAEAHASFLDRPSPEVRVLSDAPIIDLIAAADVFCGMTSIVLLDAALLGVPTLSIRPGGGPDHFIDIHGELIRSVLIAAEAPSTLEAAFVAGPRPVPVRPRGGAAGRVRELLI